MSARFPRAAHAALLVCSLVWSQAAWAESLSSRLEPLIEDHDGQVAVAVEHLVTGESFEHRSHEPMPSASLIKVAIMIEAHRQAAAGLIDFHHLLELHEADKVPGSGILTPHFSSGAKFTLRDAVRLMIAFSDNTATNLVIDQIGLPATSRTMEQLGFPNTKLHSKVFQRETSIFPDRSRQFGLGSTTADEMVRLFRLLNERKLVSPEASDEMRAHLSTCDDKLKFPRFLPEGTKVAFKTGSVEAARCAAGIIETPLGPVAVCVLTSENADHRWTEDNEGDLLCARVAKEVYDHFTPIPPGGVEADEGCGAGEVGGIVPIADPAGADGVGEHGSGPGKVTVAAAAGMRPLPRLLPADTLTGPPFTSCAAWVVADARDGAVLWDNAKSAGAREVASTTKIMTAIVALKECEGEPDLLDREVKFDESAAATPGSSCGLSAGDKLAFRDLLFGLLLPSGNDAAVAVGRLLGERFEPADEGDRDDSLSRFVAEMNREARRLNLRDTRYRNPHGLPDSRQSSSARDLARLTAAGLRNELFRRMVATREHSARVESRGGAERTVVWRNTNRLLSITGYKGVKTGYTKAAGACLVSTGVRHEDQLIVVVLGAPSADAAASDSRNLYRFAWQERGVK